MAGYQKFSILLREELDQLAEEGRIFDKASYLEQIAQAENDTEKLNALYKEMEGFPFRKDFKYSEPTAYEDIQKEAMLGNTVKTPDADDDLLDRFYGAWLGRCAGCGLGQPVELWNHQDIRKWCEKADVWPICGFLPTHSRAEQEDYMRLNNTDCTTEVMKFMPTDDDIRYTILGLMLVSEKGFEFDTWDVGTHWLKNLPFRMLCTAENQAYLNFCNIDVNGPWGIKPDNAQKLAESCALYHNPYREWIGAQIRIDAYAYLAAGDPHLAAHLAWKDAAFSHAKNGVYGAIFFAALIASAFTEKDIETCIDNALREIPTHSRFYEAVVHACDLARQASCEQDIIENIERDFGHYNVVHAINNSALCVAALVYSKGDFTTALRLSVAGGMDADCNGATTGSFMGALVGAKNIPSCWKTPIHDTLYSLVPDFHPAKISDIAKQTLDVYQKNRL